MTTEMHQLAKKIDDWHNAVTIAPCECSYFGPACPIHGGPVRVTEGFEPERATDNDAARLAALVLAMPVKG